MSFIDGRLKNLHRTLSEFNLIGYTFQITLDKDYEDVQNDLFRQLNKYYTEPSWAAIIRC